MIDKISIITNKYLKNDVPDIKPGYNVKVHQKIKEGDKERIQIFSGVVIAITNGLKSINSKITVRKISESIGVEKVFPVHSPTIQKIEVVKKGKIRRAKLYYLRGKNKKEARLKEIEETEKNNK